MPPLCFYKVAAHVILLESFLYNYSALSVQNPAISCSASARLSLLTPVFRSTQNCADVWLFENFYLEL
jgi:hypothetical protein